MYILDFECFEDEDIIFGIEDYFQVLVYRVKTDFGLKNKYSRRGELYFSPRREILFDAARKDTESRQIRNLSLAAASFKKKLIAFLQRIIIRCRIISPRLRFDVAAAKCNIRRGELILKRLAIRCRMLSPRLGTYLAAATYISRRGEVIIQRI